MVIYNHSLFILLFVLLFITDDIFLGLLGGRLLVILRLPLPGALGLLRSRFQQSEQVRMRHGGTPA